MGCGGIGGILGAALAQQDCGLVAVTHNEAIAAAINAHGFEVVTGGQRQRVPGRAHVAIPADAGQFDFVFLAMQPPQVEEAARAALPFLAPAGAMVCFQNGLCEARVAPIVGPQRTLGAIVAWGGSMLRPGVYERTSGGGFVLGSFERHPDNEARLPALAGVLQAVGPTRTSDNLRGSRWSKLAINCAISSLGTIGGDRLGALMRYRYARRLGLELMTETVAVARACDIVLEKVSGTIDLEWVALTPADLVGPGSPSLLAKHALLLAVGAKFRRLRSSMLAAIERGREPAVEYLNGEVLARGLRLGVPTPINARVRALIHALARGECRPSHALLHKLYRDSRADVGPTRRRPPLGGAGIAIEAAPPG
ncbi:MAG: ketopantoate reductase family protein [Deltaproteobacteria bacterium]|nr:ketopantoate reductase family protein [Deltaproteobacteria bacterium]